MCGIAGTVDTSHSTSREDLAATAAAMAATLSHRGPDDDGAWADPQAGVSLGFTRLAILDPTPAGSQPMTSADGRWTLVYNGEVYNFAELRKRLDGRVGWRSESDTEVLVEALAAWGVERTLAALDGMFAFAAWDAERRELTLARDRLGIKPLCYGRFGSHLVFGSDTRALRAHPAFELTVDRDALAALLRYTYVPAPRTIHRGVRKLLPGTYVTATLDATTGWPEPTAYWSAHDAARTGRRDRLDVGLAEAADRVEALLSDAVAGQMVADVPLGALLSGGVDSSTVVALMQSHSPRPVRTFTIGFEVPGYDEAPHAKRVAAHLGTEHTELYVTPDRAREVVPRLPEIYDEPFADSSQIPTHLVAALARRDVTVALSGDGGDELFGGYARYPMYRRLHGSLRRWPPGVRRAASRLLAAPRTSAWDRLAAAARPVLPGRLRTDRPGDKLHKLARILDPASGDAAYREFVCAWTDPDAAVVGGHEPATAVTDPSLGAFLDDPAERAMLADTVSYLPDDLLTKVDRASMAVSLEVRVPVLDHRLVELAWRLAPDLKLGADGGKRVLREVLHRHVPRELVDRPKMGFGAPVGRWLRGPLRGWAEELLAPARLRDEGFLRPGPVRGVWARHLAGEDRTQEVWSVLAFQAWWAHVRGRS